MARQITEGLGRVTGLAKKLETRRKNKEDQREEQLRGSAYDSVLQRELKAFFLRRSNYGSFYSARTITRLEYPSKNGVDVQYNITIKFDEPQLMDLTISFNWQRKANRKLGLKKGFNMFVNHTHMAKAEEEFERSKKLCTEGDFLPRSFQDLYT